MRYLRKTVKERIDTRALSISFIAGTLFCASLFLGEAMNSGDSLSPLLHWRVPVSFLAAVVLCTAAVYLLLSLCAHLGAAPLCEKFILRPSAVRFLIIWAFIFASWIPCFLGTYPGVFAYDGVTQIFEVFGGEISAMHPVFHSLFISACFAVGIYFGSATLGMAIYSVSQMLIFSLCLAYVCHALAKRRAPIVLTVLSPFFFALCPMFAIMAVSSTKDVFFACAVVLCFVCFWDAVREPEHFFYSKRGMLRFVLTAFFLFITKNNGIIFFMLTLPFFILFLRKYARRAALLAALCLALYLFYTGPVYLLLGVSGGNVRELLSVPIQQIARSVKTNGDELSAEDEELLYRYFAPEYLANYQPRISDFVKSGFDSSALIDDPFGFAELYVRLGARYPREYFEAVLALTLGNWYVGADYQGEEALYPFWYMEFDNKAFQSEAGLVKNAEGGGALLQRLGDYFSSPVLFLERCSLSARAEDYYRAAAERSGGLFAPAVPIWVLLFCVALCIYRKRYSYLCPLFFLFWFWVMLMLSPAVIYRYSLPLILALPLVLAEAFSGEAKRSRKGHK